MYKRAEQPQDKQRLGQLAGRPYNIATGLTAKRMGQLVNNPKAPAITPRQMISQQTRQGTTGKGLCGCQPNRYHTGLDGSPCTNSVGYRACVTPVQTQEIAVQDTTTQIQNEDMQKMGIYKQAYLRKQAFGAMPSAAQSGRSLNPVPSTDGRAFRRGVVRSNGQIGTAAIKPGTSGYTKPRGMRTAAPTNVAAKPTTKYQPVGGMVKLVGGKTVKVSQRQIDDQSANGYRNLIKSTQSRLDQPGRIEKETRRYNERVPGEAPITPDQYRQFERQQIQRYTDSIADDYAKRIPGGITQPASTNSTAQPNQPVKFRSKGVSYTGYFDAQGAFHWADSNGKQGIWGRSSPKRNAVVAYNKRQQQSTQRPQLAVNRQPVPTNSAGTQGARIGYTNGTARTFYPDNVQDNARLAQTARLTQVPELKSPNTKVVSLSSGAIPTL